MQQHPRYVHAPCPYTFEASPHALHSPQAPVLVLAVDWNEGSDKVSIADLEKSLGLGALQDVAGEVKVFHASLETLRGVSPALAWFDGALSAWHASQ